MPDRPPRRILPVPGVVDLDAVEDANFAEAVGDRRSTPRPDASEAPNAETPAATAEPAGDDPDPLGPPAPPPLADVADEPDPLADANDEPTPTPDEPAPAPAGARPSSETDGAAAEPEAHASSGPPPTAAREPAAPLATVVPEGQPPGRRSQGEGPIHEEPAPDPPALPRPAEADRQPEAAGARALPLPPPEVVETAREATRSRGRDLVQLVAKYGRAHLPETPVREPAPDAGPPRMVGRIGQLIPFLRVVPWALAALFALSFWWDFEGLAVSLFGQTVSAEGLLRVLTVSGLIGFGTNWLAITMLFQPREKRAIIPQGLIPAQRERVIYRLSEAISRELINADIIKQRIQASGVIGRYRDLALGVVRGVVEDPGFRAELKELAQGYAREVLGSESVRREVARVTVEKVEQQAGQGLGGVALKLYRTFAEDDFQRRVDRALDELPEAVVPLLDRIDTALDAVPAKVEARADEIEEAATKAVLTFVEGFDVRTMIAERARQFDEGQLEGLLKSTSNEQLNYIKYLGAILGVFGGFVIWQPLGALAVFGAAALLLWGVDEALVRARRRDA